MKHTRSIKHEFWLDQNARNYVGEFVIEWETDDDDRLFRVRGHDGLRVRADTKKMTVSCSARGEDFMATLSDAIESRKIRTNYDFSYLYLPLPVYLWVCHYGEIYQESRDSRPLGERLEELDRLYDQNKIRPLGEILDEVEQEMMDGTYH